MRIHIEQLELSCIIGLLDFERERVQRVILDIEIDYPYTQDSFIDYSHIATEVTLHLQKARYLLLEEALLGIKELLCQHYPQIETLEVKLSKPDILPHCSVGLSERWRFTTHS